MLYMDIDFEEDEWLEEILEKEKEMDIFYESDVSNIQLFFMYINNKKEILHIKKKDYNIKNSVIEKMN